MKRRSLLLLAGGAVAWPRGAGAERPSGGVRRIGVLVVQAEDDLEVRARMQGFEQGLKALGWTRGSNVIFEIRYAGGQLDRLPALAAELLRTKVDVLVAQGSPGVEAARGGGDAVPIVMVSVGDAVGSGFVRSLARPGGNITGLVLVSPELGAKRLELIKEILPGLKRVAVLWNARNSSHRLQLNELEQPAERLGLQIHSLPVQGSGDVEKALAGAKRGGAEAIVTMDDALIQVHRREIAEFTLRTRVPLVGEFRPLATAGALLSYGPSITALWRRAANYVDKILNGANPADLPVEQPSQFQLIINLKSAKSLALAIPTSVLVRADEVIE